MHLNGADHIGLTVHAINPEMFPRMSLLFSTSTVSASINECIGGRYLKKIHCYGSTSTDSVGINKCIRAGIIKIT